MPFVRFQFRRGTASQWTSANPILNDGEMAIETDTKKFKIGDGTTLWNSLAYGGLVGPQGSMSTDVSYNVNFGNAISVALDISLGGNLISKNDVSVNRYLRVSSDASFGSNLYVAKDISLGANLIVGKQIGIGKVPTSGYALDMNGNIFLSGNIYTTGGGLYNSFNYNTDLSLNANLRIGVDASFGGNVFLSKTLNLKRVILVGGTSGSPVAVNPSTSLIELNGTVDGTNNYFTLANGSYDGQTVTIVSSSSGVSDYLNAMGGTNIKLNGASCTQIRFSNSFQSVDMQWSSGTSAWFVTSWQGVNFQGVNLNFGTYTTGDINLYAAVNTYVDSKLTVNKDGTFNSNLFVGKDSSLSGNLYVLNKTTFVGDSSHNAKLTVAGDVSFGAKMTVLNDVSLNNRLTVAGDASYNGKLYVLGTTNIVGDTSLNSKLAVGGDVSLNSRLTVANDVSFGAKLTITNDVSLNSKLTVANDASFGAKILVGGDASYNGKLYVQGVTTLVGTTIFVGDASLNSKLTVAGDASFGAKVTFVNDVSLNSKLTVGSDVSFGSKFSVGGDASYNGKLYVQGVTTLFGTTNIVGDASLNSKLAVGGDVSLNSRLTVANDVSLNSRLTVANDVSFGSKLLVVGDASYNSKLYVLSTTNLVGDASLNSKLAVGGDVSLNSRLTVANDVSFGAKLTVINDVSLNSRLTVDNDVSFGSKLLVGGDASYNGKLYVQGVTTLFGATNLVGDASLNSKLVVGGDVSLNSRLTVANDVSFGAKLTVSSDVSFGSKLLVGGDASYNGKLYVLSTTNLVGDTSLNSKLAVGGDVSLNSRLTVANDVSFGAKLTVANDVSMATRLFVSGNIAVGSNDTPLGALEIKGNSSASNAPDSGYNLLRLVSTKATGTADPSYCMALGVDFTTGFGYINAAGKNVIRDVALQTRGGNVFIGNPGLTTSTGKLHIYEPIGTDAVNVNNKTFGSLVIEHGDASGASSIVFPSKKNLSNYAYLRYKDTLPMPMSDYAFDLSTNITMASFINQGIVGGVATINSPGVINGYLGYVTPTPALIIAGTSTPAVLNMNQTNLISNDGQSIAYFTQSIVKTGNQITFNAWIKPNTVANTGCKYTIFQLSDSGNTDIFNFYINGADSKLYATIGGDTTNCINNSTVLGTSSWYYVAVTYDGAGVGKIYIYDTGIITPAFTGTTTNVGTGFTGKTSLGSYTKYMVGVNAGFLTGGSGNKGYNGLIAFVNINRYPLSQADIGNFASGTVNNGALIIGAESDVSGVNQDTIVLMSAGGNGFVGVNTMRPQYPLHVNGNTALFGAVGVGKAPSSTYVLDISGNVNFSGTLFNNDVVFTSGGGGTGPTLALTGNLFVGNSDLTPGARMRVFESTGTLAAVNGVGSLVIEHGNTGGGSSLVFPSALAKSTDYAYIQYKDNNDLPMSTIALDFSAGTPGAVGSDGMAIVNTGTYGGSVKVDLNGGSTSLLQYVATGSTPTTNRNASAALFFNNTNLTSGAANTTIIADLCGNIPDSDSLSFSAWIWPTTVTSTDCVFHIFQTYNNAGTTPVVRAFLQNGYFVVQLNDNRGYYKMSNTQLSTGQWTHVTFTYNGGGVGNIYLGGSVNERLISPLVLKYDFEASPVVNQGTFPDLNGTLTTNTISSVQKKYGTSSMLCNGSGFLTMPPIQLLLSDGFTISFWFYQTTGGTQTILTLGTGGILTIGTTGTSIITSLNGITLTTGTFTTNTWQFYAIQMHPNSSGTWTPTINATTYASATSKGFPTVATFDNNKLGTSFIGYIDDFRIYNFINPVIPPANIYNDTLSFTPGYSGGSITTLNYYNTGFIGARPGYVATGSAGAAEYGIYQKGYAGYMNYFTFNNYNLSATEVSLLYNGNVDAGTLTIGIENDASGVAADNIILLPAAGNGCVGINKKQPTTALDVSGTVTATSFNATSDYRIKTDVRPLSYNNNIDLLKPVSYFNTSLNKRDIGFIAHEVQAVFPELVSGEKDGNVNQTLNYLGLIGVLTREIQGLKKTVAELKTEMEELKK